MIRLYSDYYQKEAKKVGLKVVNLDGDFVGGKRTKQIIIYRLN